MSQKNRFLIVSNETKSLEMCLITLYFQFIEHFKKNGGQFFTVYLDLLAWPYAICSFPMKKWQMPQPEMGTLDLRLNGVWENHSELPVPLS